MALPLGRKIKMRRWNSSLEVWWDALLRSAPGSDPALRPLLAMLNTDAIPLGLPELPGAPDRHLAEPRFFPHTPGFKNFSPDMALPLMAGLWTSERYRDHSIQWCERLLRYSEVRYPKLLQSSLDKWQTCGRAREGLIRAASLLMEAGRARRDVRYLNAVLKILDLKIAFKPSALLSSLRATGPLLETGLLTLRVIVQAESSLRRLEGCR